MRTSRLVVALLSLTGGILCGPAYGVTRASGATASYASTSRAGSAVIASAQPRMCRPEPPDYPGCNPQQVRPLLRIAFAKEYTGHAYHYRYYMMGQHHRGVIFAHLTPALNAKLARLYHAAVVRYALAHRSVVVGTDGQRHLVMVYPRFRTWAGFRDSTTAFCTGDNVTIRFPSQYCWSITELGEAGREVNSLLNKTKQIVLSCNGFAIGGWATGAYTGWRMGTGALAGGYYGAVGVEIGCQTTHLWNWVSDLW